MIRTGWVIVWLPVLLTLSGCQPLSYAPPASPPAHVTMDGFNSRMLRDDITRCRIFSSSVYRYECYEEKGRPLSVGRDAQHTALIGRLESCRVGGSPVNRLVCYDDLALSLDPSLKLTDAQLTGFWQQETTVSQMDDSVITSVWVHSLQDPPDHFGRERPYMGVGCADNNTVIYFDLDRYVSLKTVSVDARLDSDRPTTHKMVVSRDNKRFGLVPGQKPISFIRSIFGRDRLLIQVEPFGERAIVMEFPIARLEEAIKPVRLACGW